MKFNIFHGYINRKQSKLAFRKIFVFKGNIEKVVIIINISKKAFDIIVRL